MVSWVSTLQRIISDPRVVLPLVLLFVLFNTAFGVFGNELWGDEFRTWRDGVEKPLSAVLTWQHNADHAPLGHLLARSGAALFGVEHPWALRLGNYLCGLLCVPALYWMGRTLASNAAGLIIVGFYAVDPNCMLQITQARMYGALLLAVVLSLTLAGSILRKPERPWRRVVLLGTSIALGIWSHSQIYAVFLAVLLLSLGMLKHKPRVAVALLVAILVGSALGAQGIAKMVSRHDAEKIENEEKLPAGEQLADAIDKLGGQTWITYVLFGSTLIGSVVIYRRGDRELSILVVLIVVIAIVNLAVAAMYRPVGHARYLTILQPPMWLAMACCLIALCQSNRRYTLGLAASAFTIGVSIYELDRTYESLEPTMQSMQFAQAARTVKAQMREGDRVVFVPRLPYTMFGRYYGLSADWSIDTALGERRSSRLTRQAFNEAQLENGTIWLVGMIKPSRDLNPAGDETPRIHASDDAVRVAERILGTRGLDPTGISRVKGIRETKRMLFLRIDEKSVKEIKVPAQLQKSSEPAAAE